jgi:hypothetical protein
VVFGAPAHSKTPLPVLSVSDDLKVVGIDAVLTKTQVINLQAGRDRSDVVLIRPPVDSGHLCACPELRVAIGGDVPRPDPTPPLANSQGIGRWFGTVAVDVVLESLLDWNGRSAYFCHSVILSCIMVQ